MLIAEYLLTIGSGWLMLTLFDSNPWWLVALFSLIVASINKLLFTRIRGLTVLVAALGKGVLSAVLAYLLSFAPFFRATLGTLVGYTILLTWGHYLLSKFLASTETT